MRIIIVTLSGDYVDLHTFRLIGRVIHFDINRLANLAEALGYNNILYTRSVSILRGTRVFNLIIRYRLIID